MSTQAGPIATAPKPDLPFAAAGAARIAALASGRGGRLLLACLFVGVSSLLALPLFSVFQTDRLSVVFLAGVLASAVFLGAEAAVVAALLAFLAYNFFLTQPRFAFRFAGPEDVFVLVSFLAVALFTGGVAGRLRDQSERSAARAHSLAILFGVSRELSAAPEEQRLRERLAAALARATARPAWVPGPGENALPAEAPLAAAERAGLETALLEERRVAARAGAWRARRLCLEGQELGWALWAAPEGEPADRLAETERLTEILVEVGTSALSRARFSRQFAEAEALARTEQLRTALLSSISHDFRTPLSAILASATTLSDFLPELDEATRRDLLGNIQEEAERLNRFVANLLNMTKLESGVLEVTLAAVSAPEVVSDAVERLRARTGASRIATRFEHDRIAVRADPVLLEQVLVNLIDNAITFAPEGSDIEIAVFEQRGRVLIEVRDSGPGAPEADLPRLFDKFFRAGNARQSARGTGLGLAICKGLVEAMGGAIAAHPRTDRSGLVVAISLGAP